MTIVTDESIITQLPIGLRNYQCFVYGNFSEFKEFIHYDPIVSIITPNKYKKILSFIKFVTFVISVLLTVFTFFASIGFGYGYYSQTKDVESIMSDAFRNHQISAINQHTIKYSGEAISFSYDLNNKDVEFEEHENNLFKSITLEKVMMAVSIPLAFTSLFKSARYGGNGKGKAVLLVVGSVGILCGYSIGMPIGENYANYQNEKKLKEFLSREDTRKFIQQNLSEIYQ